MATQHLDLDEQETVANLKYFWQKWGKLISAVIAIICLSYAGITGWKWWQTSQAQKAAAVYEQLNKAVDAGDATQTKTLFHSMRDQFGGTNYTAQAALLSARMSYEKQDVSAAKESLQWLIASGAEAVYKDLAKLRLAGLLIEAKDYAQAQKTLESGLSKAFEGLAADRIGDALYLQNKLPEATEQYQKAYSALGEQDPYKKMVEVKLARLGLDATAGDKATKDGK